MPTEPVLVMRMRSDAVAPPLVAVANARCLPASASPTIRRAAMAAPCMTPHRKAGGGPVAFSRDEPNARLACLYLSGLSLICWDTPCTMVVHTMSGLG